MKTKKQIRNLRINTISFSVGSVLFLLVFLFTRFVVFNDWVCFFSLNYMVICAVFALPCWIAYGRVLKHNHQNKLWLQQLSEKEAKIKAQIESPEFQTYLQKFETLAKLAAELIPSDEKHGFSRFGGLPLVPSNFQWPQRNQQYLDFVAQIDFTEINPTEQLKDFPQSGLLYLFVDFNHVDCQVLFYPKSEELTIAKKPDKVKNLYREIYLTHKIIKTYPDYKDCPAANQIHEHTTQYEMDELYSKWFVSQNVKRHLIGGWASYDEVAYFIPNQKVPEDWILLCQIVHNDNWVTTSTIHDGYYGFAHLYFYIRKEDLLAHKFDQVKLDLQL